MNSALGLRPRTSGREPGIFANRSFSTGFIVLLAAFVATIAKLLIAWNTIGTNDSIVFFFFGRELASRGVVETYQRLILFNHPPLVAYFLRAIYELSQSSFCQVNHVSFPFLLRLPGIAADFVSTVVVCRIAADFHRLPLWALLLFALNPISIMVSGFHGNTDPVMVMFLLFSCLMILREKAYLAGIFLALSCQIKIAPTLLLPAFLLFWRKPSQIVQFLLVFCGTTFLLSLQPLLLAPAAWARNVLTYGSYFGLWGVTCLLHLSQLQAFSRISFFNLSSAANIVNSVLKLTIIGLTLLIAWRRRGNDALSFLETIALIWVALFIFAPGIAPQYFVWITPFLLFLSPVWFACLVGGGSIFLFVFYNTIAHGLPWYLGVSTNALGDRWAPWSLLPWLILIVGAVLMSPATCRRLGSYVLRTAHS
jgi:Gpi18-like mannosyltransferase